MHGLLFGQAALSPTARQPPALSLSLSLNNRPVVACPGTALLLPLRAGA